MATLTKLGTTPHAIRYQLDGASGGVSKTQAALIADLAAGPLKALLQKITTDAAWAALANDPRFMFDAVTIQFAAADNWTQAWNTGGGRSLNFAFGQTGNAYQIALRFVPTPIG